jgi:hypothetical protein
MTSTAQRSSPEPAAQEAHRHDLSLKLTRELRTITGQYRKRPPNTGENTDGATGASRGEFRGEAATKFRARRRFSHPYLPPYSLVARRYPTEFDFGVTEVA